MTCRKIDLLSSRSRSQSHNENVAISTISSKLLIRLQPDLEGTSPWARVVREKLDCCVQGQSHIKMSIKDCSDDIFWTTKHFVNKLSMMMHHYEPECQMEKLVHCLQGQCHSEVWYSQNMTVSTIYFELPILLQLNLILLNFFMSQIVLWNKEMDWCVQGEGHSKTSKCQWMFVRMRNAELFIIKWYHDLV